MAPEEHQHASVHHLLRTPDYCVCRGSKYRQQYSRVNCDQPQQLQHQTNDNLTMCCVACACTNSLPLVSTQLLVILTQWSSNTTTLCPPKSNIWHKNSNVRKILQRRIQIPNSAITCIMLLWLQPSVRGSRSFAVAGPTTWNSLPEYLRYPELSIDSVRRQLKTFLFAQYWRRHSSALETFVPLRSINLLFTLHYITIVIVTGGTAAIWTDVLKILPPYATQCTCSFLYWH